MSALDWPALWAREPGLRPEGVHIGWDDGYLVGCFCLSDGSTAVMPTTVTAALCRDAAVRWLAEQRGQVCIGPSRVSCYLVTDPTLAVAPPRPIFDAESLDAALFAACKALLDARDAAPR